MEGSTDQWPRSSTAGVAALLAVVLVGLVGCGGPGKTAPPTSGGIPLLNLTQGGKGITSCRLDSNHRLRAAYQAVNTGNVDQTFFAAVVFRDLSNGNGAWQRHSDHSKASTRPRRQGSSSQRGHRSCNTGRVHMTGASGGRAELIRLRYDGPDAGASTEGIQPTKRAVRAATPLHQPSGRTERTVRTSVPSASEIPPLRYKPCAR